MDQDSAFALIQSALETFSADVDRVRADHALSEEVIAVVEYELAQVRKLVAENTLPVEAPQFAPLPSRVEVLREDVGGRLEPRLLRVA